MKNKKHFNIYDHLGTLQQTYINTGFNLTPSSMQTQKPFGGDNWSNSTLTTKESTLLNWIGKEKDNESNLGDHGVRKYEYETGRFISIDPLWANYYGWTPYQYSMNSPVMLVDAGGLEPILSQAGTANGFINTINTTGTMLGLKTGKEAHIAMLGLGKTNWTFSNPRPMPLNTGRINKFEDKYIYTSKGGWLDMAHFMFYAGKAYQYKIDGEKNPIGEAVQDGYKQEMSDELFASHSAYSYEDLPSDRYGAFFGANYFNSKSELTFGEQLQNFLNNLGATTPENVPNFNDLPENEPKESPSKTNHTTKPILTK